MLVLFCMFVCASGGGVMTGEPRRVPANSTEVLAAARFAVLEFNRANVDGEPFEIVNVTSAKKQVVAGINYILEVQLGRSTCSSRAAHGEPCDPTPAKCNHDERSNVRDQGTRSGPATNIPVLVEVKG